VGVVTLVVSAFVLRATTKKIVDVFEEEKCIPEKNPGYAYDIIRLHDCTDGRCAPAPAVLHAIPDSH